VLQEQIALGQRVERFTISRYRNGKWLPLETNEETTTIGYKRIIRFKPAEMEQLRIRFVKARGPVVMKKVSGYR
jgi:alpha-L-fucosidase